MQRNNVRFLPGSVLTRICENLATRDCHICRICTCIIGTLFWLARVPFSVMSPNHRGSFRKIVKRKGKLTVKQLCWGGGGITHENTISLCLSEHRRTFHSPEISISVVHEWMVRANWTLSLVPTHLRVLGISSIQFLLTLPGLLLHGQVCPLQLLLEGSLQKQLMND